MNSKNKKFLTNTGEHIYSSKEGIFGSIYIDPSLDNAGGKLRTNKNDNSITFTSLDGSDKTWTYKWKNGSFKLVE